MSQKEKKQLGLVGIGHVDSGKSTLLGHLIHQLGGIDKSSLHRLEKLSTHAGRPGCKYAWMLDKLQTERERGITIKPSIWGVETPMYACSFHDVPGHRDLVKNMITGTSQADAAILVVSAAPREFEAGISREGQTREHALLAYTLGIKQLIIACNKMDTPSVNYAEDRYHEIVENTTKYLKKIGFKDDNTVFIPVSAWHGDNLAQPSPNMPWYSGPTIVNAIDALTIPDRAVGQPFRLPVRDVFKIAGVGTVVTGLVESGSIRPNTALTVAPSCASSGSSSALETTCCSIEAHYMCHEEATAGQNIGMQIKAAKDAIRTGSVCSDSLRDPVKVAKSFEARIVLLNYPKQIRAGFTPMIDCHTSHVKCRFHTIKSKIDRKSGAEVEKDPQELVAGDAAIVQCIPVKPMVVEKYSEYPPLGRFAIRDINQQVIGIGIVLDVEKQ